MTAPFPTHKQEEWRYADLDALKPVWEQFAEPVTLSVAAGESLEEVWLPVADDVQLRRVQLALGEGAKARIFALNSAPVYGRIELDVSLEEGADFELYGANIGTGLSTNEFVTNVRHVGPSGRSRQVIPTEFSTSDTSTSAPAARSRRTASNRSRPCCSTAARPRTASPSWRFSPTT